MDNIFWVVTYLDEDDNICRKRFEDDDEARSFWYNERRALYLDQVHRYEERF